MASCKYCSGTGAIQAPPEAPPPEGGITAGGRNWQAWAKGGGGGWMKGGSGGWMKGGGGGWMKGGGGGWMRRSLSADACHYCDGTGDQKYDNCSVCRGVGYRTLLADDPAACPACLGIGKVEILAQPASFA